MQVLDATFTVQLADGGRGELYISVVSVGEVAPGIGTVLEVWFSGELLATLPGADGLQATCSALAFIASELRRSEEAGVVYYFHGSEQRVDFGLYFSEIVSAALVYGPTGA